MIHLDKTKMNTLQIKRVLFHAKKAKAEPLNGPSLKISAVERRLKVTPRVIVKKHYLLDKVSMVHYPLWKVIVLIHLQVSNTVCPQPGKAKAKATPQRNETC